VDSLFRLAMAAVAICVSDPSISKESASIAGRKLDARELQSLVVGASIAIGNARMGYAEHFRQTGEYIMFTGEWGASARGSYKIVDNQVCIYWNEAVDCRSIVKAAKSGYYWVINATSLSIRSVTRLPA
jgi:hypothetical protein